MMDAFDVIEGGCVVAAAAGIAAALRSCMTLCGEDREFLRDALQVVAQLGSSPEEKRQLLHLWTVVFGSVGQEQSAAALAVCVGTGDLAGQGLGTFSVGAFGSLV